MVRLGRNGLEARRLRGAREIIAQVADHLRADLSVELWNGERLPLGPGAREDIRIAIRSPAAARRLIVNPSFMSVVELYAEGELDLVGATPLEASRRWDHDRSLELLRKVDRWAAFKSAMPFLVGRARSRSVADYDRTVDRRLPNPGVKATDWTVRPAPREKESVCIASRSRRSVTSAETIRGVGKRERGIAQLAGIIDSVHIGAKIRADARNVGRRLCARGRRIVWISSTSI